MAKTLSQFALDAIIDNPDQCICPGVTDFVDTMSRLRWPVRSPDKTHGDAVISRASVSTIPAQLDGRHMFQSLASLGIAPISTSQWKCVYRPVGMQVGPSSPAAFK